MTLMEQLEVSCIISELEADNRRLVGEGIALKAYIRKLQGDIELLARGTDLLSQAIQGKVGQVS